MINKKNDLVVKSNRLVEASYRLGLTEQRIILYAICRSREDQTGLFPDQPVTITADTFLKQFPSIGKNNVYERLKEAMDTLYSRSVTIHDTDPATQKARVRETRWISEKAYIDGAGQIQVVFTPEVIRYITRLEIEFTSYQLEKVSNMTSAHAIRIYELLAQHLSIGSRTLGLASLRESLQLESDEYKLTSNLVNRVIDPSVEQINKHSDLTVSYKPLKTSRAITDFVFKIRSKDKKPKAASTHGDQAAREKLEALGQQRLDVGDEDF